MGVFIGALFAEAPVPAKATAIAVLTLGISVFELDPMTAVFWSAIANGVISVPIWSS
jgi:hypothetical protein